jgi:hypothetical protein
MKLHPSLPERLKNLTASDLLNLDCADKSHLVAFLKNEQWDQLLEFANCLDSKLLSV